MSGLRAENADSSPGRGSGVDGGWVEEAATARRFGRGRQVSRRVGGVLKGPAEALTVVEGPAILGGVSVAFNDSRVFCKSCAPVALLADR